ncbi:DUF6286 domain-containing protein [Pseudarthrobacter oxydans]|uniref:hypothetical protein n=1 Tax=Pseudarthrobacter oxydans TaxID=1671 RepID=UPI003ED1692D
MNNQRLIRRMVRRETHSSRAAASVLVATVLLALCLWLALEAVLMMAGVPALLASPGDTGRWLAGLPSATIPGWLAAAGVGIALLGVLLVVAGMAPGRRPRRALASDRCAVVVDDDVIAAAVSRTVQLSSGVAPGQVTTTVAGRSARVQVRPTSGLALDAGALTAAASSELARYGLATRITPAVRVASSGAVGQ